MKFNIHESDGITIRQHLKDCQFIDALKRSFSTHYKKYEKRLRDPNISDVERGISIGYLTAMDEMEKFKNVIISRKE